MLHSTPILNLLVTTVLSGLTVACMAQESVNYDESQVPAYKLPDLLVMENGKQVASADDWWQQRRPELFELFATQMYGRAPDRPSDLHWEQFDQETNALNGTATRKQVAIYFSGDKNGPRMDLLLYLPNPSPGPVPIFLGLNFNGNHTVTDETQVRLSDSWFRSGDGVTENRATESARGKNKSRWPIKDVLARGFGVATIYYGDIDPDFDDGFKNGVHSIYHAETPPTADQWGSIATWAWGLSRGLDYLEADPDVDGKRVIVVGHSRLGKTALWAGAADQRFAMVVSNDSGCGGAALSRRRFGEKVKRINTSFPHWFADNFNQYNDREDQLPIDQHQLIALIAPRPVLICSAEDDRWADPLGEFLAAREATSVFELLGKEGISPEAKHELNRLIGRTVGYHIRPGEHDMTPVDWKVYLQMAESNSLASGESSH